MLTTNLLIPLPLDERLLYESLVPEGHFLRQLLKHIDFEAFRPTLEGAYKQFGRPPVDVLYMLKLELLSRQYDYSDREVIGACLFNIAYRLFLGLSLKSVLPHPTSLTYFRQRLGPARLREVFDILVGQARRLGLVKDRLRLKDATHIIANIAVPSTIRLVADTRDQLLDALQPCAAERVAEEVQRAAAIATGTADAKDAERLLQRVSHLQAVLAWADDVPVSAAVAQQDVSVQERLRAALALAHQVLADRDPQAGDKVLSVHDPDARCGKHGEYFDGYLLDLSLDADSNLITALNVLPANGNEGADAVYLLQTEEQAHGNDVEAMSIDGAGYRGELLRELTDPQGLNVEVFVPPTELPPPQVFGTERFSLTVLEGHPPTLTCPAGQTTTHHERTTSGTGTKFRFSKKQCSGCPWRAECLANPTTQSRTVVKNDYEAEYRAAQAKARTPEYAQVRKQHPAIERKLGELVNRHGLRHARYRGLPKVLYQGIVTSLVVNLKRIVRLLAQALPPPVTAGPVRAELAGLG